MPQSWHSTRLELLKERPISSGHSTSELNNNNVSPAFDSIKHETLYTNVTALEDPIQGKCYIFFISSSYSHPLKQLRTSNKFVFSYFIDVDDLRVRKTIIDGVVPVLLDQDVITFSDNSPPHNQIRQQVSLITTGFAHMILAHVFCNNWYCIMSDIVGEMRDRQQTYMRQPNANPSLLRWVSTMLHNDRGHDQKTNLNALKPSTPVAPAQHFNAHMPLKQIHPTHAADHLLYSGLTVSAHRTSPCQHRASR
jgi:hypothetical protein